jgi:hypothetical protein
MWFGLALLSAFFQVLRNMSMKHLGHALDDTINVGIVLIKLGG